jgi:ribosomal protein L37E
MNSLFGKLFGNSSTNEVKTCQKCGMVVNEQAKYCHACGTNLIEKKRSSDSQSAEKIKIDISKIKQKKQLSQKTIEKLKLVEECHKRIANGISENYISKIENGWFMPHSELCEVLNDEKAQNSLEELEKIITWKNVDDIKKEIEDSISVTAEILSVEMNTGNMDTIKPVYEELNISGYETFSFNRKQISNLRSRIQSILNTELRGLYSSLNSLQNHQQKLINLYPVVEDSGLDCKSLVKIFGSGIIAASNPFIGIPLMISNFIGDSEKNKKKKEQIEMFFDEYQKYLECWDTVRDKGMEHFKRVTEEASLYLEDIFCPQFMQMVKYAAQHGEQKKFHSAIDNLIKSMNSALEE